MRIFFCCCLIFFVNTMYGQSKTNTYLYNIDLLNVQNDEVLVSFTPPKNKLKKGKFIMPKLVPGYYSAMNFGQYVSGFKAIDKTGKEMLTERLDTNSWLINDLNKVATISYAVADGWDSMLQRTDEAKSPSSTFNKDSVFIINYNSLVGYFEELKEYPYSIKIKKNKTFYASSALQYRRLNDSTDVVNAGNYRKLVDAPVMYCEPDTTWLTISNTKVLVSFYNKESRHFSKTIAAEIASILKNQNDYLGGRLPVNEYAFLIYHESGKQNGFTGDGLEHSNSTVCLHSSTSLDGNLIPSLMSVASHEFFHIITPLNIHSKEIQFYDFLNPVMSKHLWLYEGMTEYATIHMPIKQKMIPIDNFLKNVEGKIKGKEKYDDNLPLTEMSKNALTRQDQYMNVYLKGALLGLCLDIRLRELSKGKMGTQDLILKLMKKYGGEKPFNDDALFDEITKMTFPEIRVFFKDHVEGRNPLPLKEYLLKAGFDYDEKTRKVKLVNNPTVEQLALRKAWIDQ